MTPIQNIFLKKNKKRKKLQQKISVSCHLSLVTCHLSHVTWPPLSSDSAAMKVIPPFVWFKAFQITYSDKIVHRSRKRKWALGLMKRLKYNASSHNNIPALVWWSLFEGPFLLGSSCKLANASGREFLWKLASAIWKSPGHSVSGGSEGKVWGEGRGMFSWFYGARQNS